MTPESRVDGEAPTVRNGRLTRTADTVNTGLMAVLVVFYVGNRVFPGSVPGLDTVFPVVAAVAFAVSMSAWGVESGVLPTAGEWGGGDA